RSPRAADQAQREDPAPSKQGHGRVFQGEGAHRSSRTARPGADRGKARTNRKARHTAKVTGPDCEPRQRLNENAVKAVQPPARTFWACRPFGPRATSNSTFCPSTRVRKPSMLMAE